MHKSYSQGHVPTQNRKFYIPAMNSANSRDEQSLPISKPSFISRRLWTNFPSFSAHTLNLRSTLALMWSVVPKKQLLILLVLWGLVFPISFSSFPLIIHWGLDHAIIPHALTSLSWISVITIGLGLLSGLNLAYYLRYNKICSLIISYRIISAITEQSMRLGRSLRARISTGEIVSIGSSDVVRFTGLSMVITRIFGLIWTILYTFCLLWHIRLIYAIIALCSNILVILLITPSLILVYRREHIYRISDAEQTGRSGDIVSGLRVLAGIGGMDVFAETFSQSAERTRRTKLRSGLPWVTIDCVILLIGAIALAIILYLAYDQVVLGKSTLGEYAQVIGLTSIFVANIWVYTEIFMIGIPAKVSAERILSFLRLKSTLNDHAHALSAPTYPAILQDIQSEISVIPGKLSVLVAENLHISTALAHKFARVIPEAEGIMWGDIPLARISLAEIRERILFSDNDDHLFSGTLRDNLTLQREFSLEHIHQAMRISCCDDLLEILDQGLESTVRENGLNLSGGQRQRIRLARAILFDPEILILIDPTSAVDAQTEMAIARRLAVYRKQNPLHSTLIVSNSSHIINQADEVFFLDGGNTSSRISASISETFIMKD